MKNRITLPIVLVLLSGLSFFAQASESVSKELYKEWCLIGMSKELDGDLMPEKSIYHFTEDNKLKYQAGFFKQENVFTIEENKIKAKGMGNYKIISIQPKKMILHYGGYLHFEAGSCK